MPLLISGDASFAGRGWSQSALSFGLRGHRTGGSVHFIVNNQIGFTHIRATAGLALSSDVAKMIEAPIFHATAMIRAVVFAAKSHEFRQSSNAGRHDMSAIGATANEGDEPMFTSR